MDEGPGHYSFQPLERRGVLLGLGGVQLVCLLGGALTALLLTRILGGAGGAMAAVVVLGLSSAAALISRQGFSLVAWIPVLCSWTARRAGGPKLSQEPLAGTTWEGLLGQPADGAAVRARRTVECTSESPASQKVHHLPGVRLTEAPALPGQRAFGVIRDGRSSTAVSVVPVVGGTLGLLDPEEQIGRVEAWRAVLAALARSGGSLRRIQWVERSGPTRSSDQLPSLSITGSGYPAYATARDSYAELVATRAPSRAHQVLIAIAVPTTLSKGAGQSALLDGLRRELRLLEGQLRRADLSPGEPLSLHELSGLLSPPDGTLPRFTSAHRSAARGPMASIDRWSVMQRDGDYHVTYWVAEWPRLDVGPDFLSPLLVADGRRAVSVVMGPVPFDRAMRQARSARTADLADEEIRSRAGFLPSARRRREAEGATDREEELAAGHVEYRFSGYVTVTAPDHDSLAQCCAETEQAAQEAHLELRRLYGRQAEAYTWTLPLARGLG